MGCLVDFSLVMISAKRSTVAVVVVVLPGLVLQCGPDPVDGRVRQRQVRLRGRPGAAPEYQRRPGVRPSGRTSV